MAYRKMGQHAMGPPPIITAGRLTDKEFAAKFREYVYWEFADFLTESRQHSMREVEKLAPFLAGEKMHIPDIGIRDRFARCCQDVRLKPEEINELRDEWFHQLSASFVEHFQLRTNGK